MNRLACILIMVMFALAAKAQDVHFSQFYANPINLAPSLAGGAGGARFVLNFRNQWPQIPGNYVTYAFSADQYFPDYKSGVGLQVTHDNAGAGTILTTDVGLAYSYRFNINRDYVFQPGLAVYYHDRRIGYSGIRFADQYYNGEYIGATSEVLPEDQIKHADFAVSALVYHADFWAGVTVDHLMNVSPELRDDYRYANMRLSVFGGYKYQISKRRYDRKNKYIHLTLNYYYQSLAHQVNLGCYYNRRPIILGLWYRGIPVGNELNTADALIFMGGVKHNGFTFSYSYDMSLGKLISRTGGSHEIGIIYTIESQVKSKRKFRAVPCPEI